MSSRDLIELLEETYPEPKSIVRDRIKTDYLSPSRIVKCARGAFVESFGFPEPVRVKDRSNFDYGQVRHDDLQERLLSVGYLKPNPEPIEGRSPAEFFFEMDDPRIIGYCDGITADGEAILEIKTTAKRLTQIKSPLPYHIEQATLYMHMAGIGKTEFLYESKGDLIEWKTFEVELDEEIMTGVLTKARYLRRCIDKKNLPFPGSNCPFWCRNGACHSSAVHGEIGVRRTL